MRANDGGRHNDLLLSAIAVVVVVVVVVKSAAIVPVSGRRGCSAGAVQQPLELGRRLDRFHFAAVLAERFREQLAAQVGQTAEQREQLAAHVAAADAGAGAAPARHRRGGETYGLAQRVDVRVRQRSQRPRTVAPRQAPPPPPPLQVQQLLLVVLIARPEHWLLLVPLGEQHPYLRVRLQWLSVERMGRRVRQLARVDVADTRANDRVPLSFVPCIGRH